MTVEQDAADILDGFVPMGDAVPEAFAEFVAERIAARPSPTPAVSQQDRIEAKLDELLTLLRGGTPE